MSEGSSCTHREKKKCKSGLNQLQWKRGKNITHKKSQPCFVCASSVLYFVLVWKCRCKEDCPYRVFSLTEPARAAVLLCVVCPVCAASMLVQLVWLCVSVILPFCCVSGAVGAVFFYRIKTSVYFVSETISKGDRDRCTRKYCLCSVKSVLLIFYARSDNFVPGNKAFHSGFVLILLVAAENKRGSPFSFVHIFFLSPLQVRFRARHLSGWVRNELHPDTQ